MQNVHFTPPELAKLFGVNPSTVKRWVDKKMLKAEITIGGHRRIFKEELDEFIKRYPQFKKNSYVISKLSKTQKDLAFGWQEYYQALYRHDIEKADRIIRGAYVRGTSLINIFSELVIPTLFYIGELWQKKKISIHDEHRMSFRIRQHIDYVSEIVAAPINPNKTIVLACAPGDNHHIPHAMAAALARSNGYNTIALGINTPYVELSKAIKRFAPQLVVVTQTYSEKDTKPYIERLAREFAKDSLRVLYGGSGWSSELKTKKWNTKNAAYVQSIVEFNVLLESNDT